MSGTTTKAVGIQTASSAQASSTFSSIGSSVELLQQPALQVVAVAANYTNKVQQAHYYVEPTALIKSANNQQNDCCRHHVELLLKPRLPLTCRPARVSPEIQDQGLDTKGQ